MHLCRWRRDVYHNAGDFRPGPSQCRQGEPVGVVSHAPQSVSATQAIRWWYRIGYWRRTSIDCSPMSSGRLPPGRRALIVPEIIVEESIAMGKVLVLYDSASGNTAKMASLVVEGAGSIPGVEVRLRKVDESTPDDLLWCDGLALGGPTNM